MENTSSESESSAKTRDSARDRSAGGSLLTLMRGLQALEEVARARGNLTPKELARRIDVNIGTAYQILRTLLDTGYVERQPAGGYILGPQVAYLSSFLADQPLHPDVVKAMRELNESSGQSVYLSLRRGNSLRIVLALEGTGPVRVQTLGVGYAGDLHARATGRVFLAHLGEEELEAFLPTGSLAAFTARTITSRSLLLKSFESIREDGYYAEYEEYAEGVACIAAPVFGPAGRIEGAVGLSRPSFTIDASQTERLIALVCDVAGQISRALGEE